MPTVDLTDDELAALSAAIQRLIDEDKFPRAPRLDLLRSALAKLDPVAARTPPGRSCRARNPRRWLRARHRTARRKPIRLIPVRRAHVSGMPGDHDEVLSRLVDRVASSPFYASGARGLLRSSGGQDAAL
jgi:hypothetical protein